MSHAEFSVYWDQGYRIINEFAADDGSVQRELRVNGTIILKEGMIAYKKVLISWVASKLQDSIPVTVGYADEPFDVVFVGGERVQAA
jgi:hypothetical protein